jgi:hypothetical protein
MHTYEHHSMLVPTLQKAVNTSTSQTLTADRCLRQWHLDKVFQIKQPEKQATFLGNSVHERVECFEMGKPLWPVGWEKGLTKAEEIWVQRSVKYAIAAEVITPTDEFSTIELPICILLGPKDQRGLPFLAEAIVEWKNGIRLIKRPTRLINGDPLPAECVGRPYYVGFIDRLVMNPGSATVIDHKTSKNTKWAKTSKKLKVDPQVNHYSMVPFILDASLTEITVRHNIFLKEPEKDEDLVYKVEAVVELKDALAAWHKLEQTNSTMTALRKALPLVHDKTDNNRGERFKEVPGVIDGTDKKKIRDGCDAFGGCPYKDACSNNCSIQQLTNRLDHMRGKTNSAPERKGPPPLNIPSQEKDMVFNSVAPAEAAAPQQVETFYYMNDPTSGVAYKCAVFGTDGVNTEVGVYPIARVEPDWESIPPIYRFMVPAMDVLASDIAMPLGDYQELTIAANMEGAQAWKPAPVVQSAPEASAPVMSQQPAQVQQVQAASPLQHPDPNAPAPGEAAGPIQTSQPPVTPIIEVPAPTYRPAVGQTVEVLQTNDQYWSQYMQKRGIITQIGPDGKIDLEIDGLARTGVDAGRFKEVVYDPASLTGNPQHDAQILVNQLVHVELTTTDSPFRGELAGFDPQGIIILNQRFSWDQIQVLIPMTQEAAPGDVKGAEALATKKAEDSAEFNEVVGKIRDVIAAIQAKKSPTMPKKQQEEVLHLLDVLGGKEAPASTGDAPDQTELNASYDKGYENAIAEAQSALNELVQR